MTATLEAFYFETAHDQIDEQKQIKAKNGREKWDQKFSHKNGIGSWEGSGPCGRTDTDSV